ncbi:MAG: hypothetical protein V1875_07535 [Candidatus Altiarchaeota archaeon]
MTEGPAENLFLVTSQGYTATKWMAWALNSHPQIYCSHWLGGKASDMPLTIADLRTLYPNQEPMEGEAGVEGFLRGLKAQSAAAGKLFGGNVGGYVVRELDSYRMRHQADAPLRTVNIVRHPIQWIASGVNMWTKQCKAKASIQAMEDGHMASNRETYSRLVVPQVLEPSERAFCFLCGEMMELAYDARMPWAKNYRMEDVTRDRQMFARMVGDLTGLDVSQEGQYLENVFTKDPINNHNPHKAQNPEEQYRRWSVWQRRVYQHWLERSELKPLYEGLGYDMSQVKTPLEIMALAAPSRQTVRLT